MKRLYLLILFALLNSGYTSETDSGVVSETGVIVRTSIQATAVLQSDTSGLFRGSNEFGGTSNFASSDSGGIFYFRNVTSSEDVVQLGNNDWMSWVKSTDDGTWYRSGVSADDIYTISTHSRIQGRLSGEQVHIVSMFATSINTTELFVSGGATITSDFVAGTCTFTFGQGLLTAATC